MTLIKEKMKQHKKKIQIVVGGLVLTLSIGTLVWANTRKNAYVVYVGDKEVATVKDKQEVEQAFENIVTQLKSELGADIAVNEIIEVKAVHSKASDIAAYDVAKAAINEAISYGVEAYEVLVDGISYAVVSTQDEAVELLSMIAKEHLPGEGELTLAQAETSEELAPSVTAGVAIESPEESPHNADVEVISVEDALPQSEVTTRISVDSIQVEETEEAEETEGQKIQRTIQSFDFNEEVAVRNVYVETENILSVDKAEEKLLAKRTELVEYTLAEGDNIWDIAMKYGTTMERILEINPTITDETKMQIGDVIQVEQSAPILSITTIEEATFKEVIPAEIEYVEFSDLYKDETKVYQQGNDGLKELTVEVTKINGVEVSRRSLAETTLKEAKTTVIAYGTKEKPVSSGSNSSISGNNSSNSGNVSTSTAGFMHPLNGAGRLSSDYGSRWGSFHKGLDIAASAGTPVYASAAGKVIYSGYNSGGYGKLVIIEHSNGVQTYYAHNSSLYVSVGQSVSKGTHIAAVGSTGNSTGNHVHFEVRKNGTPVNPWNYIG